MDAAARAGNEVSSKRRAARMVGRNRIARVTDVIIRDLAAAAEIENGNRLIAALHVIDRVVIEYEAAATATGVDAAEVDVLDRDIVHVGVIERSGIEILNDAI